MTCAIALDTETTDLTDPDVIELAATAPIAAPDVDLLGIERRTHRFKPRKPISLGALATHHILESDLEGCEPWTGSWAIPEGVTYVVAHNADFDWKAIGSPHVARICTLALSRSLWPDLDSHSLGAMTYFLQGRDALTRELLRGAHSASTDLILCMHLLRSILKMLPATQSWHQLWVASERARLPKFLTFGKYGPHSDWAKASGFTKGMPIGELQHRDPGYLSWLLGGRCDVVNEDLYLQKALRGEAA
ncbi:MAG: 3'-5' exonuclease [Steroidobacteraceae bacterium]